MTDGRNSFHLLLLAWDLDSRPREYGGLCCRPQVRERLVHAREEEVLGLLPQRLGVLDRPGSPDRDHCHHNKERM
jgi:hypothetical protein